MGAIEQSGGGDAPATHAFVITKSDTVFLPAATRAIWVGGAGNIQVTMIDDGSPTLISGINAGTMLAIRTQLVWATNSTATLLVGFY